MTPECFQQVADRLTEPLLLVASGGMVVAANRAARSAVSTAPGESLEERVADPPALRRFLALASRSTSSVPGRLQLRDDDTAWRCDASRAGGSGDADAHVFLHLRRAAGAASRFLALNDQIERLHAEMRRRQSLEQERQQILEAERLARQAAEEANRLKDEFLASVSHELRTPLQAISGWVNLLRMDPTPEMLDRALDVLERNISAHTQLTEDLVDVSRVITGRMRLAVEPVDLAEIVTQAVESIRPAADGKGLRLEVVVDSGGCIVNADPDRMLQVVWNLLSNAAKFTPRGGRVQVVVRRVNSHAEILVSDTGEGIDAAVLPYVFDRFRQADGTTTRRHGGLGLGLAIVRHLVELHGGVVVAYSDGPDRGATFTVNLPMPIFERKPALAERADAVGDTVQAAPPAPDDLAGCQVLLVEDHDDSRHLLERILAASGARVTAVDRAEAALASFAESPPDVVISDIELPGEDGFTMMRKIRDLEAQGSSRRVPAIAVTAHSIGEARLHALRAGYQTFLIKPINPSELIALVKGLCALGAGS